MKANQQMAEPRDANLTTRHDVSLSFSIPLLCSDAELSTGHERPVLLSYTRAITGETLELLVPSLPFVYRYLMTSDFTLRFALTLPDATIEIEATPIYDKPLDDGDTDIGYILTGDEIEIEAIPLQYVRHEKDETEMTRLVGVRIKKMRDEDRALYNSYIESLNAEPPLIVGQVTILPDNEEEAPKPAPVLRLAKKNLRAA